MKKAKTPKSLQMRELLRDYVLILANTGIRHGTEAMNLKWRDIENWKNEKQHSYLRVSVSGKTGRRSLIARDGTAEYFDRIKSRFDELNKYNFQKLLERKLDVAVFRLADGTVTNNLNQTFESFMKDSGLMYGVGSDSKRTLYSLRHTYATLQLMEGRGIHELAKQMGTSVQMIEQHYSKITPELMAYEFADRRRTDARKETEDAKVETAPKLKVVK
jgi:integrase